MNPQSAGLSIALAQINPTVGDIDGNAAKISEWIGSARERHADLVVFPELCLPGYPAEDLYLKRHFVEANLRALEDLAAGCEGIVAVVGFAEPVPPGPGGRSVSNSLGVLADGRLQLTYRKNRLPNYAVFDEQRYFEPGAEPAVIDVAGVPTGLTICEDCWVEGPPASLEAEAGAALIVNPSGSPYHRGKGRERLQMFADRARAYGAHFAFANLVGGQDELVFDGESLVFAPDGSVLARAAQFEEELLLCSIPGGEGAAIATPLPDLDEVYAALVLGLRDYVRKNGFRHVGIGLSGGIDSALVALIACDALGAANVSCVVMPSPHSSAGTQADARAIAANLGAETVEIPIEPMMDGYDEALRGPFGDDGPLGAARGPAPRPGAAVRARPRRREHPGADPGQSDDGALEQARLVDPDHRQQERDVGRLRHALRGHGGRLRGDQGRPEDARLRAGPPPQRAGRPRPGAAIGDRASPLGGAETRTSSTRTRFLPTRCSTGSSRPMSSAIRAPRRWSPRGCPPMWSTEVIRMVDRAEYKRRQAPPGIRITPKAFGRDRRLPITNRFRG